MPQSGTTGLRMGRDTFRPAAIKLGAADARDRAESRCWGLGQIDLKAVAGQGRTGPVGIYVGQSPPGPRLNKRTQTPCGNTSSVGIGTDVAEGCGTHALVQSTLDDSLVQLMTHRSCGEFVTSMAETMSEGPPNAFAILSNICTEGDEMPHKLRLRCVVKPLPYAPISSRTSWSQTQHKKILAQ